MPIINLNKKSDIQNLQFALKRAYKGKTNCKKICQYNFKLGEKVIKYKVELNINYDDGENHEYGKGLILSIGQKKKSDRDYLQDCLNMIFSENKKLKDKSKIISFRRSYINQVTSAIHCAIGKDTKPSGTWLVRFANKLNTILDVEISELSDQSKLHLCKTDEEVLSLKLLSLIRYGVTWYERAGGFKLKATDKIDGKNMYDYNNIVRNFKLKQFVKIANDRSALYGKEKMDKGLNMLEKFLKEHKLSHNITISELANYVFNRKNKIDECISAKLIDFLIYQIPLILSFTVSWITNLTEDEKNLHNWRKVHILSTESIKIMKGGKRGRKNNKYNKKRVKKLGLL